MRDSSTSAVKLLAVDEYLARERTSHIKHEYIAGEVYAMSPVSKRHSTITINITHRLRNAALARSCEIFNDVVVRLAGDRYYYPDVVVACGASGDDDEQVVHAPCFVVEVTSPSTRATDLREKVLAYRDVPTIQGYLIAEQKRRRVIVYNRISATEWAKADLTGSGVVNVPCIDVQLSLDEIYGHLELPPMNVGEENDEYTIEDYEREWVLVPASRR